MADDAPLAAPELMSTSSDELLTMEELPEEHNYMNNYSIVAAPSTTQPPPATNTTTTTAPTQPADSVNTSAPTTTIDGTPVDPMVPASAGNTAAAAAGASTAIDANVPPPSTTPQDPSVVYPRPFDVLLPAEGYQLWTGNVHYLKLIERYQHEFSRVRDPAVQQRITSSIIQAIQKHAGRFLTAVEVPLTEATMPMPAQGRIVRATVWEILEVESILVHLRKALRSKAEDEERRFQKKRRARERRQRRQERREARRRERAAAEKEDEVEPISPSDMGPLASLYYVPSYYPSAAKKEKTRRPKKKMIHSDSESSSASEPAKAPVRKKAKPVVPTGGKAAKAKQTVETVSPLIVQPQPVSDKKPAPELTQPPKPSNPVNFHYKPKPMKSLQAIMDSEGELVLPKGVTVRPSGKWQAQTYFAGQSRYVGVYDTSRLAARAYIVVQDYLRQYRASHVISKDSPKESLAGVFAQARRAADAAVRELRAKMAHERETSSRGSAASGQPPTATNPTKSHATSQITSPPDESPL